MRVGRRRGGSGLRPRYIGPPGRNFLRRRAVTLVAGASSRTKILEVAGADPAILSRLLAEAGPLGVE